MKELHALKKIKFIWNEFQKILLNFESNCYEFRIDLERILNLFEVRKSLNQFEIKMIWK